MTIAQQRFFPQRVVLRAGGRVTWTNGERHKGHQVRARGQGGFTSPLLLPGQSWSMRFPNPGRYDYDCLPHPDMRGSVEVVE